MKTVSVFSGRGCGSNRSVLLPFPAPVEPGLLGNGPAVRTSAHLAAGALTGVSGPLYWRLGWTYNGDHSLTAFTNPKSEQTFYNYCMAGALNNVVYPDNSSLSYLYNNIGSCGRRMMDATIQLSSIMT